MSGETAVPEKSGSVMNGDARLRSAPRTYWRWVLGRVMRVRLAKLSLSIVLIAIFMALFAGLIAPYSATKAQLDDVLLSPSVAHPMGTDDLGRDVLSRIIYGTRASLSAGVVATGIGLAIGTTIGLVSGFFLGAIDSIIMRVMDALLAFPGLILALAITAALGPSLFNAMIAIGVVSVPRFSRLARGQVLTLNDADFVTAARSIGARNARIMFRHIGPNMLTPIIIQVSLSVAFAILTEASLSFLGLGVQPPTPSWGFMLNQGRDYVGQAPWLALFPGVTIFLVVMAFNLLGDAVRDALDPRLRI